MSYGITYTGSSDGDTYNPMIHFQKIFNPRTMSLHPNGDGMVLSMTLEAARAHFHKEMAGGRPQPAR